MNVIPAHYDTRVRSIAIGSQVFQLHTFSDFEKTVDDVIQKLQASGVQDLSPDDCPYFGELWHAAIHLARIIDQETCHDQRFLELGCGLALPSLVAASKGAFVDAVDLHRDVEPFLHENMQLNQIPKGRIRFHRAAWRDYHSSTPVDLIVASDVLYEEHHVREFVSFVDRHLTTGRGILIDPCRWYHQSIIRTLQDQGFDVRFQYVTMESAKLCEIRFQRPR